MTDHRDEHEPYGFTESPVIARLRADIARITAERDEARRTLCRIGAAMATLDLQEYSRKELGIHALTTVRETNVASMRGWDCFKEDGK